MSLHVPSNKKDCPGFSPRQLSQRFPDNPFYEMVLPFHSKQPNPSNHSSYFILYCFRHNLRRTQAYKQKLSNDIVESHFQYVEWDRRQDDKSIQVFDRRVDRRYHADHFIQRHGSVMFALIKHAHAVRITILSRSASTAALRLAPSF